MYKVNIHLEPIVSGINSLTHPLAQYILAKNT